MAFLMALSGWLDWTSCLIAVVSLYLAHEWYNRRNLPPGPFSLPLLGSVGIYRKMIGLPPHIALAKMSETYGDVTSVWVGPGLIVVLSGFETIHQAYVTQGVQFTDRPNWLPMFKVQLKEGKGVTFSNGEEWQTLRKLCLKSIKDFGIKTGEIEAKIVEEVEAMKKSILQTRGDLMDIRHVIQMSVNNVISSVLFGQRFKYDDPDLHDLIKIHDLVFKGSGIVSATNYLPKCMHPLFPREHKFNKERETTAQRVRHLMADIYEHHEDTFDSENIRDFMDIYIQSSKEDLTEYKNKYFHKGNLWRVINDLFLAGSETVASALEWTLLFMIEKPELQQKCQHVIQDVVGDRLVQLSDRSNLSYIDAVLNEVLRLANVVPFGLPRTNVSRDITLKGFTIPRNSIIIPNIYTAHMDPEHWPDPLDFKPERFLDDNGQLTRKDSFIPFSIGPRNCFGEQLGRLELFLVLTNLLQKFTFKRDESAEKHDFSPDSEQSITLRPSK